MRPQELARILEADGWYVTRHTGSHRHYRHPVKPGLLIVPMHAGKELGTGIAHDILKKAGLK
jgi:predicted RNA binding protein YcfA (HicA-like mRNA interferase family)